MEILPVLMWQNYKAFSTSLPRLCSYLIRGNMCWLISGLAGAGLAGWKNTAAVLYGVEGIPMNYLVDKNGKIIAKGLRDEDLDKTLATFLK